MKKKTETKICCPREHSLNCNSKDCGSVHAVERDLKHKITQSHRVIEHGSYRRKCDGIVVQRYLCTQCRISFSSRTGSDTFKMRKLWIHKLLKWLLVSGVSKRQSARILQINKKTVDRKIPFLAQRARHSNQLALKQKVQRGEFTKLQFDDLETFEHTKMKPLSVPLVVCAKRRLILAIDVAQMPAKGHLAAKSRKKYGRREDRRPEAWNKVLSVVASTFPRVQGILSDENPHYPRHIRAHFPKVEHATTPGGRGCVAGYGELKKKGFDKMFSLNHTCAMLRDHLACLKRSTWTTTKKPAALKDLLDIYVHMHNESILKKLKVSGI